MAYDDPTDATYSAFTARIQRLADLSLRADQQFASNVWHEAVLRQITAQVWDSWCCRRPSGCTVRYKVYVSLGSNFEKLEVAVRVMEAERAERGRAVSVDPRGYLPTAGVIRSRGDNAAHFTEPAALADGMRQGASDPFLSHGPQHSSEYGWPPNSPNLHELAHSHRRISSRTAARYGTTSEAFTNGVDQ